MKEDIGKKLKQAVEKLQKENDINSAIYIIEKCLLGSWVIKGYRVNPVRQALKVVLKRIKELEEEIDNSYNTVVKLTRENTKLKYDLFRSISKEKVREIAEQYEDKAKRIAGTYQYAESREDLENKKRIVIELRTKAEALQELLKEEGE